MDTPKLKEDEELIKNVNKNVELTRGFKEYEAQINNLKGIFTKVDGIINVDEYRKIFDMIRKEVEEDETINRKMPSNEMQLDYEGLVLAPYIKRLEDLAEKMEDEILPFYKLHLLQSKIEIQVDKITEDTLMEIIENTKRLIDSINNLNTHNNEDKNNIIASAYNTIYRVILNEEIFDRTDILDYIRKLDVSTNRETLGRLLSDDLKRLSKEDIIDDDLKNIDKEKLGNDYLSNELVRKVSIETVGATSSEYQRRKKDAIELVEATARSLTKEKEYLLSKMKDIKKTVRNLRLYKIEKIAQAASIVLIPVMTFAVCTGAGANKSKKIKEYQSTTRTIDYKTGNIIGDIEATYDEVKSPYTATILSCTPWRANPAGVGYIRNITTYEYNAKEEVEGMYKITQEDLEQNVTEKYTYVETKDVLDENDSTTDNVILITETYQDGTTRESTKFIIPGMIIGVVLGLIIDAVIVMTKICSPSEIKEKIEELTRDINDNNLDIRAIEGKLNQILVEAEEVKNEYNDTVKKYGTWQDKFIMDGIDTSWLIEKHQKRK